MTRTTCSGAPSGRRRALALAAISAMLMGGCSMEPEAAPEPEPFVFRSLDLRQNDEEGRPAWDLRSPEARYEIDERRAEARDPEGTLYNDGRPSFRISAQRGTVINDGETVILNGDVRIRMLGDEPLLILAPEVIWEPGEERMRIERDPVAIDGQSRLRATRARFQVDEQMLQLIGEARLEHWPDREESAPPIDADTGDAVIDIRTGEVRWNLESGALTAKGPVNGERRREEETEPQTLVASALSGNSREGYIDLMAPVRVEDPAEEAWMDGGQARWRFTERELTSPNSFRSQIGAISIQGRGYRIEESKTLVIVESDCDLSQPGERLRAERCRWDWEKNRLLAEGAVELRRDANDQVTRAQRLEGRMGDDGRATFSTPGGRVLSELTVTEGEEPGGRDQPRSAPPVDF
ncbi:LPS export ABC transporter periplasmic protein LptC [Synechococcus sp. RSCCF101]|uniref:LPS export ABC transporter periplasmic protein LptC n=1 Tax=Synechococcus sp. RSCCF101 TaxID=2511069 RepID=UPI0012472A23|nr:LPS export ABC transporter periplasmic protein LptC [Synechococcus sp. RSCCF101]QEY31746.1 LPS export ABC transporter periplasmic protein LptC [Synechococcus sp. RSCCF101]